VTRFHEIARQFVTFLAIVALMLVAPTLAR